MENSELKYLKDILRIPSVSTLPQHEKDMGHARKFITNLLASLGFNTQILPGLNHSAVFGQLVTNPQLPTVLIYGHYDVQPPDPLNEWHTPPFIPTIKQDFIYARGATDNKGQFMVHIMAIKRLVEKHGPRSLPANIKFLIEGEEEIGSISIKGIAQKYKSLLKADYLVLSDTEMPQKGQPAIHISLRGLLYTEIRLTTADHDLHSGQFGGVAPNPATWLASLITKLKAEANHILIPGFYDSVISPSPQELADFQLSEPSEAAIMAEGSQYWVGGGERDRTLNERRWSRPTLDINGFLSGFTGDGSKTIIPKSAMAKISMRLVPNQDPTDIFTKFEKHVRTLAPPKAKLEIIRHADCLPYKAPTTHPVFTLAKACLKNAFKKPAVFYATGGSIGAVPILTSALNNLPCLMIAMGNADDNLHAPNEHFSLDNYSTGIQAMVEFYSSLSSIAP